MNEEQNLRYSIQLIDSEADVTRTVRLSLRGLRMIAFGAGAAVAVLTGAAVLSVYTLMHSYLHESETAQLREANRIQQEQILQVSKKASTLQQDLDSLRRSEDGLRALVGAPQKPTRRMLRRRGRRPRRAAHRMRSQQMRWMRRLR